MMVFFMFLVQVAWFFLFLGGTYYLGKRYLKRKQEKKANAEISNR